MAEREGTGLFWGKLTSRALLTDGLTDMGMTTALPLSTSVIWGRLVILSEPFFHLQNRANNIDLAGLEEGVKITGGKHLALNT